jgi:hypothetical protein
MVKSDFSKKSRINKYDQPVYTKLGRRPIDKTKAPDVEPVKPTTEPTKPEIGTDEPEPIPATKPIPKIGTEKEPENPEELPQPKVKEKPPVNPEGNEEDEENRPLQEQINKIKSLMFKIKFL